MLGVIIGVTIPVFVMFIFLLGWLKELLHVMREIADIQRRFNESFHDHIHAVLNHAHTLDGAVESIRKLMYLLAEEPAKEDPKSHNHGHTHEHS